MYACKTVVFIMIYSSIETTFASIELTFGFDRMNSRSNELSIETTFDRTDSIQSGYYRGNAARSLFGGLMSFITTSSLVFLATFLTHNLLTLKLNKIEYMTCSLIQGQVVKNQLFHQFGRRLSHYSSTVTEAFIISVVTITYIGNITGQFIEKGWEPVSYV